MVLSARKYLIIWLGFPPKQDTTEPRSLLLRDSLDIIRAYKLTESSHPVLSANVNDFVLNESDKATHCVGNENVVVTGFYHDQ